MSASATPAKRTRTLPVVSAADLDASRVNLLFLARKDGEGDYVYVEIDSMPARLNLTPAGSLDVVEGFDFEGKFEKRSFNDAFVTAAKNEYLTCRVEAPDALIKVIEAIEAKCIAGMAAKAHFKPEAWQPTVKTWTDKVAGELKTLRLRVVLTGDCTNLRVLGDEVEFGAGWPFLSAAGKQPGRYGFWHAKAKVVVALRLYEQTEGGNTKFGLTLTATQLALKPWESKREEENVLLGELDF